ncbi:DUF5954 family protein [Streptomyces sp. NPDC001795]|uniref:DUF5954 family protein n=1 Tax=Streptomyces sp. NPDC001795 TaxID=3154525 RepID=UPI0033189022
MDDDWQQQLDEIREEFIRRNDPAAWVKEADAADASLRYPNLSVRGPVFGVAVQDPAVGPEWRLLKPVTDGMPQMARDGLNSHLFFTAKDGTDDRGMRRELLAAVATLEREPVNEVEVCGVRYRVVRGDEFTRSDDDGCLEPPRPTDPEPLERSWDRQARDTQSRDIGFGLDPDHSDGPMEGALKLALRDFAYTGDRYPADMRADSERAVATHPEIVLLPVGFSVAERDEHGWRPRTVLAATPHDARRTLYNGLDEIWALLYQYDDDKKARYAKAAQEYRALDRADEFRVDDRLLRICRVERLLRMGPDGPEPPRPSDIDEYGPMKLHPTMDEDGNLTYD